VGNTGTNGLILSPTAEVSLNKHEALCANDPSFIAVWERKKSLKDSSPSGYDMSLACHAAIAGLNDQEIVDLLIHHRRKHGSDLKIERFDYYQATISKARRVVGCSVAMNQLEVIHDTGNDGSGAPEGNAGSGETANLCRCDLLLYSLADGVKLFVVGLSVVVFQSW